MPTVFPEDLVDTVITADAIRRQDMGMSPARYKPSQRVWIEPFFNLLGTLWGITMRRLPWRLRRPLDLWLCQKMQGHAPEENPKLNQRIQETVEMAVRLRQGAGQWPAVLFLISHPPTVGPMHWLRFELLRQGILIADALADAKSRSVFKTHARCFLAVDPYALDTVPPAVGGFYAAWMHHVYMAWDRQPSTQSWIQRRWFLKRSGYAEIGWRLISALKKEIPILMALPGGLPHNARLLYTAREFIQRLKPKRWPLPKTEVENRFMHLLVHPIDGVRPAEHGELSETTRRRLQNFVQEEVGFDAVESERLIHEFREEFRRAVPYRARLFRALHARLVAKGKPLLLVALAHSERSPHVRVSAPTLFGPSDSPDVFAKRFVTDEF